MKILKINFLPLHCWKCDLINVKYDGFCQNFQFLKKGSVHKLLKIIIKNLKNSFLSFKTDDFKFSFCVVHHLC
jgi:hypothetical protein